MGKIKVVWICHFSNKEVRDRLPLSGQILSNAIKKVLGKKTDTSYYDFAPWISKLIYEFEKFYDVELHIVAPHHGMKVFKCEFEISGVFYHFFKPEMPFHLTGLMNQLFKPKSPAYSLNRRLIKQYLRKIDPDIVNLIGAENPYYSIASLDIINKPVFVSAQTVYTNPARKEFSTVDPHRWDVELKIHQKEKYFGCGGRMHYDLILNNNPKAIIFKNFFPISKPPEIRKVDKYYDFVFFAAQVTQKKGIEDALEALAIVKSEHPNASMTIVGKCDPAYKTALDEIISHLEIKENVTFAGYFPVHADMYQHITLAHFAILPIKLDVISSTVVEAMHLELPVVTYKTTGTPYLNKDGETVLLANIGDIKQLAVNMKRLLEDNTIAIQLKEDARKFVENEFDNTKTALRLVNCYHAVIDNYHHNTSIPEDLLFNTDEFPAY